MRRSVIKTSGGKPLQCNLTAMIDVVFILITFFMLICRSIGRENFKLSIPDRCGQAVLPARTEEPGFTVSVFRPTDQAAATAAMAAMAATADTASTAAEADGAGDAGDAQVCYAVRADLFDPREPGYQHRPEALIDDMTQKIVEAARKKQVDLVHLRADKRLTYGQVQPVLEALARAHIHTVRLAAYRVAQADGPAGSAGSGRPIGSTEGDRP